MDFSIVLSLLLALLAFKGMNYHIHSCQYSYSVICEPTVNFNILKHKCHGFLFCFGQKMRYIFNCHHAYYRRASKKKKFQEKKFRFGMSVLSTIFMNSEHYFGTLLVYAWDCRLHEVAYLSLTKPTEPMHSQS